jgi:hypothetical protein
MNTNGELRCASPPSPQLTRSRLQSRKHGVQAFIPLRRATLAAGLEMDRESE